MCVENKITNNGPIWVLHGLKFQYRIHIGPLWTQHANEPIWDSFDHACCDDDDDDDDNDDGYYYY